MLRPLPDGRDEYAGCERVQGAAVPDLHVEVLVVAPFARVFVLAVGFAGARFGFEPRAEERGGFEVGLQFADYVGGADVLGFVDGFSLLLVFHI